MLGGLRLDYLVSSLPPGKQSDIQGHPPGVMAAHLMEDAIAGWTAERLTTTASQGGVQGVGQEVLHALLRGLKATRVAERLLQKLADFVKQANLPPEVYDRIRREVMWFTLPEKEKQSQLVRLERFTAQDFDRLLHYVQEAVNEGRFDEAAEIAQHYFAVLDKVPAAARAEELQRAPQLLHNLAGVQTLELMHTLAEPLVRDLLDETRLHWPCHLGITNCLAVVAENAGRFEDFEFVCKIASDLKRSLTRHPLQHVDCCGSALSRLLPAEVLDRLIELCLQKRSDAAWVKTATSLLVMIGSPGAEAAFRRLEEEPAASNRLPLIRLIRNLGTAALEATRKRLADARWYVVRNAAYVLGDLGDPELPAQLRGALRHPDPRVQQAAITAILKSNAGGRGEVLAEALPNLQAGVLEMALDELTVLKDPASLGYLEALLVKRDFKAGALEKAVIALAAIPSDRAAEALYKILADTGQALLVRRTALGGLCNHPSAAAAQLVAKLTNLPAGDPLSAELKKLTEGPVG
jgi:HEAT repeat protein